ncbi:hypothetical protein [Flavihumibacter sp. CACIAM 22H1]|uniref:hypothetical protein n=1 Tax=Flavihumibacter sp. CACIAM 22H1 TaxID=1812911 RepID=UPI0007A8D077|nr:hypothetical protein [Flavihumibacter sp. CACIAM 22H1]KYP12909.1 MAG: hypothetical protein A1D16_04040 [Flavihumibacter sp. CACIAM 22H1]
MNTEKLREVSSHRLKEAIVYLFLKAPEKEFTFGDIGLEVLKYFAVENDCIPENEIIAYRRRLYKAVDAKVKTGFISARSAKNSVVKNYVLYKLARP